MKAPRLPGLGRAKLNAAQPGGLAVLSPAASTGLPADIDIAVVPLAARALIRALAVLPKVPADSLGPLTVIVTTSVVPSAAITVIVSLTAWPPLMAPALA